MMLDLVYFKYGLTNTCKRLGFMFDGGGVRVSVSLVRYWVELGDWLDGLLLIWVA